MKKLLRIKPFRQSSGQCGPASLKMILGYYGITKSERELVKLTKSNKTGTKAKNIISVAKSLGMNAYIKDNSDFNDISKFIKRGIPVIVDWFSHDEGHYSVAVGTDKENIYLLDPELGHMRAMKCATFIRTWFDFENRYMKTSKDLILRRIIVISRKS